MAISDLAADLANGKPRLLGGSRTGSRRGGASRQVWGKLLLWINPSIARSCRSHHVEALRLQPDLRDSRGGGAGAARLRQSDRPSQLNPGETVLDLGSGGGIDVLLSAKRVGPAGKACGLDMTDEMLNLARANQRKAGVENVEFLKGEIENIPLLDNSVDVTDQGVDVDAIAPQVEGKFMSAFIRAVKPASKHCCGPDCCH